MSWFHALSAGKGTKPFKFAPTPVDITLHELFWLPVPPDPPDPPVPPEPFPEDPPGCPCVAAEPQPTETATHAIIKMTRKQVFDFERMSLLRYSRRSRCGPAQERRASRAETRTCTTDCAYLFGPNKFRYSACGTLSWVSVITAAARDNSHLSPTMPRTDSASFVAS